MTKISRDYMVDLVKNIAGPDVIQLVDIIKDKENVSEFKIAEKLKLTVNQVRNMLYRLAENNLVTSTRKKDKKKGWYIYYWTFDHRRAILLLRKIKQDRLNQLKNNLKNLQEINYFICKACRLRYSHENAMELGFLCSNCAQSLAAEDHNAVSKMINKEMAKLEFDLAHPDLKEPIIVVEPEPVKKPKKLPSKAKVEKKVIKKAKPGKKIKKIAKKAKKIKPKKMNKKGFVRRLFSRKPKRR